MNSLSRPIESLARAADRVHAERLGLNVWWLIKLRWAAAAGQTLTIAIVAFAMAIDVPTIPLLCIVAVELGTNLACHVWYRNRRRSGSWHLENARAEALLVGIMLVDVLLLSGLLYLTGGSYNPFSIFYLVNLALAAVLLPVIWAWVLNALALGCYLLLWLVHVPLLALQLPNVSDPLGWTIYWPLYMQGLVISFAAVASFNVYFITRLTRELSRLEAELSLAQLRKAETDKLEALATLAAGAAHELATPLSTIAVVARELERELERSSSGGLAVDDARLIRSELDHCREILDRMSVAAGEHAGEEIARLSVASLVGELLDGVRDVERVVRSVPEHVGSIEVVAPRIALSQSLRAIVQNAIDASPVDQLVTLNCAADEESVQIYISDRGSGMPPDVLARAGEPFFTTKQPGEGMGLGLFIARRVIERIGGQLKLESQPDQGTTAAVFIPRGA